MKILVVDDHPFFLDGLKQTLRRLNSATYVESAYNSQQALEKLDQNSRYDLVLLDLHLPDINGIDLLSALTARGMSLPIAIISAQDDINIILQAMNAGALGFIPKSYGAEKLKNALQCLAYGEIYLPDTIAKQLELMRSTTNAHNNNSFQNYGITPSQYRVLKHVCQGYSNKEIALVLNLSEHTIKSHIKALFIVLNVSNRMQCIKKAKQLGVITKQNNLNLVPL